MTQTRILTGITASGTPHLGNYVGAIKPAIEMSQTPDADCHYFVADYHSLVKLWDPALREQYIYEIAATWLALGLDIHKTTFYRQSDVPETFELYWIITSLSAKGLLNRSHAYKALVAENDSAGKKDPDFGITMGLFCYPILMAADILMPNASQIPVGKDQIQHVEIARDIAGRFNHVYGDTFTLPEAVVDEHVPVIPGLDGRKMSKSYGNTIPLFCEPKKLKKLINKIKTNSQLPEEPKNPEDCHVFQLYRCFASESDIASLAEKYRAGGMGWGEAKSILFDCINSHLSPARERYTDLIHNRSEIDKALQIGAEKARALASASLAEIKRKIGIAF